MPNKRESKAKICGLEEQCKTHIPADNEKTIPKFGNFTSDLLGVRSTRKNLLSRR